MPRIFYWIANPIAPLILFSGGDREIGKLLKMMLTTVTVHNEVLRPLPMLSRFTLLAASPLELPIFYR